MVSPARNADASTGQRASLRSPTLPDRVLQELRRDLARGGLTPGQHVSVAELAERFDVSPLPVREALRVLLAEGRMEYSSHRGFQVTSSTASDVEEIFLICGLLESEAMRRGVPALTDADIARMKALLKQLAAKPRNDEQVWDQVEAHQEFHFVPIDAAQLPRMSQELRRMWDHTDHYRALYLFREAETREQLQTEHEALFAACAARDGRTAVRLMKEHRQTAIGWLARGLGRAGDGTAV